jgi:two-component system response regulator NreC
VLETTTQTITIVLADDHPGIRGSLRMLLESQDDFEVVAEAGDVEQARRFVLGYKPTVLVLDLSMPGGSGLDVIPVVQRTSPDTAVVVLTMLEDTAFAREALGAGARGYVHKRAAATELVQAIRTAAAGGTWLNPALGARLAAGTTVRPSELTRQELDVLRLMTLGKANAEIAVRLDLSVSGVEAHRARIQQKLGRSARAELVGYALEHDLLDR